MSYGTSLGVPPLAGLASYPEAARTGFTVERNVGLLKRYAYVERRLMEIGVAHIRAAPEWEVKCALSLHCWLDAEHATVFRERVAEMREPPLHLDAGLIPELGDRDAVLRCAEGARAKLQAASAEEPRLRQESKTNWWPAFHASIRQRVPRD